MDKSINLLQQLVKELKAMDEEDRRTLVRIIVENCHKYDEEGRVINLTADEVVAYATVLSSFILGETNVEH